MDPGLRTNLFTAAVCVVAVVLAWQIAEGSLFSFGWMGLVAMGAIGLCAGAILVRLFRLPVDVIVVGLVLLGYLAGNRGFAQFMLLPGVPLLPAEAALGLALAWRMVVWAKERRLPFRADALNVAVVLWLVAGTARMMFDTEHGFTALRDYAMVYYALFFFVVQAMAQNSEARRFIAGCLIVGLLLIPPLFLLNQFFPRFFLHDLTLRGAPLIYFKGDLAYTFLAVGSLVVFFAPWGRWQPLAWLVSAVLFLLVLGGDSRASLLALGLASLVLLAARHWRFPVLQGAVAAIALCAVVTLAHGFNHDWSERKLEGAADRLRSMADVRGTGRYQSQESFFKGDNNRFRLVWWRNVIEDTWHAGPVFGLGFGADLARGFTQEYYPDAGDDFNARSPHNIFITVFGRMGAAGLAVWCLFTGVLATHTWRTLRAKEADGVYWGVACLILVSASFGVVLEGPMGAVPFWVILGMAHAASVARETETAQPAEPAVPLPVHA